MTTPPTSQTNPLDPVFSGVPVIYPQIGMVTPTWNKWFVDLREKVNVINAAVAALSGGSLKPVIEVHAGSNVSVDNTDIQNPIVSATGGGGGGGFISAINTKTSTPYTLALSDAGTMIDMNVSGGVVAIPAASSVAFPAASSIQLGCRSSEIVVSISDASITVIDATSPGGSSGSFAGLINIATNLWYLWGAAIIKYVYRTLILSYSPVAYWTFDNVLTSLVGSFTWTFQSGTALTYVAPLITSGNAASMTSAYYSIPYNSAFTTFPFSLVFWVEFTTSSNLVIFECNGNTGFSVQVNSGYIQLGLGGASNPILTPVINDGKKHCIVISCTATQQYIYTDGVLSNSYTVTRSPSFGGAPLYLGSRAGTFLYSGILDELAYIPAALTASDAKKIYISGT